MLEQDFRDAVRGVWNSWIDGREAIRGRSGWGSGKGAPDLSIAVRGKIIPVELKRAKLLKNGCLRLSESDNHEDQAKWHAEAANAGIFTFHLVGLLHPPTVGGWRAFPMLKPHQNEPLHELHEINMDQRFTKELIAWIDDHQPIIPAGLHAWR